MVNNQYTDEPKTPFEFEYSVWWFTVTVIAAWWHCETHLESPIRVQERTISANGTSDKIFISKGINWGYGFQDVRTISRDCACQYSPHFQRRNDERGISGTLTWVIILVKFLQAFQRSQWEVFVMLNGTSSPEVQWLDRENCWCPRNVPCSRQNHLQLL